MRRQRRLRAPEVTARGRAELRRAAHGGAGRGPEAVAVGGRVGATLRYRAGHRAQRAELPGAVALLLPEVPPTELPRVCGRVHPSFVLGQGLL